MDKDLELKSFAKVDTKDLVEVQRWGDIDPKLSEALNEMMDKASKVVDPLTVVFKYVKGLPDYLKGLKLPCDAFRLVDDIRRIGPIRCNLESLSKIDEVLSLEDILPSEKVKLLKEGRRKFLKDNKLEFKYFYSDYDEYKRRYSEEKRIYVLNKWKIYLLELKADDSKDLYRLREQNETLEKKISRKHLLKEKVIHNEVVSINKHNRRRLHWKFGADLLSFAANMIEVFTFPVVAAFVCACRTPSMIYAVCRKICRNEEIKDREVKVKDDCILTTLQLPALVIDFWNVIDKWILKKIREKSEESRKKEVLNKQLEYVKDNVVDSVSIFDKIEDKDKQKELIERLILLEDRDIQKETVEELENIKKQLVDVLNKSEDDTKAVGEEQLNSKELVKNVDDIREKIEELSKEIEKQNKKLQKIENNIIDKTEKGSKFALRLIGNVRKERLNEAIAIINKQKEELNIGKEKAIEIRSAFELSKQTLEVIKARPREFYLKCFAIKPMEDEEKMKSTARFFIKHIKDLPDIENLRIIYKHVDELLSKEEKDKTQKEVEKSYNRIKEMLKTLNMDEEEAANFIRNVQSYKWNKDNALKSKEELIKDKEELIKDLVEKMKKEI